jgi:hypothetical protein
MAVIWVEQRENQRMDAKTIKNIRQRLAMEYENLIKSNNRKRLAAQEITVENTEDEGDLAHDQPR